MILIIHSHFLLHKNKMWFRQTWKYGTYIGSYGAGSRPWLKLKYCLVRSGELGLFNSCNIIRLCFFFLYTVCLHNYCHKNDQFVTSGMPVFIWGLALWAAVFRRRFIFWISSSCFKTSSSAFKVFIFWVVGSFTNLGNFRPFSKLDAKSNVNKQK